MNDDIKKGIARDYLRKSRADFLRVVGPAEVRARRVHVVNARRYGLSDGEIADVLGVGEGAVAGIGRAA